jgi:hypothetical protein
MISISPAYTRPTGPASKKGCNLQASQRPTKPQRRTLPEGQHLPNPIPIMTRSPGQPKIDQNTPEGTTHPFPRFPQIHPRWEPNPKRFDSPHRLVKIRRFAPAAASIASRDQLPRAPLSLPVLASASRLTVGVVGRERDGCAAGEGSRRL